MTQVQSSEQIQKSTCLGDKVMFLTESKEVDFALANGQPTKKFPWTKDQFWEKLSELAITNENCAKLLQAFANLSADIRAVRDPFIPNGYIVNENNSFGFAGREGQIDFETGEIGLPKDPSGRSVSRYVCKKDSRYRAQMLSEDKGNRAGTGEILYFHEDGTINVEYLGPLPVLLREEIAKSIVDKGASVFVVPLGDTKDIMISITGDEVTFYEHNRSVTFPNADYEFWLEFAKRATDARSEQAFQARLIVSKLWRVDPGKPTRVLQPDGSVAFWCRESRLDKKSFTIVSDPLWWDYNGRTLFHPSVSGLYISEQCGPECSYYGPWHVMKETTGGESYFLACSQGDEFEDALKTVAELLSRPRLPEPLPPWREDGTLEVDLLGGYRGKVQRHSREHDEEWSEDYTIEVLRGDKKVGTFGFGADLGHVLKLRNEPDFFFNTIKNAIKDEAEKQKYVESRPEN